MQQKPVRRKKGAEILAPSVDQPSSRRMLPGIHVPKGGAANFGHRRSDEIGDQQATDIRKLQVNVCGKLGHVNHFMVVNYAFDALINYCS